MQNSTPARISPAARRRGFTLIELLMVITVIMILVGITFGISRGVQNAQARAKAKAELATIAQALEQFKSRYGDYPWVLSSDPFPTKNLAYALSGRLVIKNVSGNPTAVVITDEDQVDKNPKFLDLAKFSTTEESGVVNNILDPWGNAYRYYYKYDNSPTTWDHYGYHLLSIGPSGSLDDTEILDSKATGVLVDDVRKVANEQGIIFVGE